MKMKLNHYYVELIHINLQVQMVLATGFLSIVLAPKLLYSKLFDKSLEQEYF